MERSPRQFTQAVGTVAARSRSRGAEPGLLVVAWAAVLSLVAACSEPVVLELDGPAPPQTAQPQTSVSQTPITTGLTDLQPIGIGTGWADSHAATAKVQAPCLRAVPGGTVKFLSVATGKSTSRDVVIENCGGTSLTIAQAAFVGGPGLESTGLAVGETLAPGSFRTVTLRAWPVTTGAWSSIWRVQADGVPPLAMPLTGEAHLGCLVPELKLPAQVLPGAQVQVDVAGSQSPTGANISARWTVTPPDGLVAAPVLADAATSSFTAAIAGTWRVCADVTDTVGTLACAQVCSEVDVIPSAGLHVELLWQPLATSPLHDRTADISDLDLHLAMIPTDGLDRDCDGSPEPWFSSTWDVWAATPSQPWGLVAPDDDGVLAVENHHGLGPEIAEVQTPSGTATVPQTYTIAVHHWDSHGNGPALARLRIFVEGLLVGELGPQPVEPLALWTAARVRWPNALSGGDVEAVLPCHQIGDPCDGGMRWASQGDACVDRCVVPVQSAKTMAPIPSACAVKTEPGDSAASPNPEP